MRSGLGPVIYIPHCAVHADSDESLHHLALTSLALSRPGVKTKSSFTAMCNRPMTITLQPPPFFFTLGMNNNRQLQQRLESWTALQNSFAAKYTYANAKAFVAANVHDAEELNCHLLLLHTQKR